MVMFAKRLLLISIVVTGVGFTDAFGTIIGYTSEATFKAQTPVVSTETFDELPSDSVVGTGSMMLDGVLYVPKDTSSYWYATDTFVTASTPNSLYSSKTELDGWWDILTFGTGKHSPNLGFYLYKGITTPPFAELTILVTATDGEQYTETIWSNLANPYHGYFASQGIASVKIMDIPNNGHGVLWIFDNVSRGQIVPIYPVPEPVTMLGLALGIGGLTGYLRKRRRC